MSGGDGFRIFKDKSRNHKTGTVDIDHFVKYVTKMSPILIGIERRINIIEQNCKFRAEDGIKFLHF